MRHAATSSADDERWAAAAAVLATGGDPDARLRARRRRLALATVVGLLALAAGGLLAVVLVHAGNGARPAQEGDVPGWRGLLCVALSGTGLVACMVGLLRMVRASRGRSLWSSPALPLNRSQKVALLRQLRGREPVDPARLPLLTELARRQLDLHRGLLNPLQLTLVGGLTASTGSLVISASPVLLLVVVPWVVALPLVHCALRRDSRRADLFLTRHPDPAPVPRP